MTAGLLFLSCGVTRQNPSPSDPQKSIFGRVHVEGLQLPPNTCRIVGTLLTVDTVRLDSSGPCARIPCYAWIHIDSVVGYGSSFPRPLAEGETVEAKFPAQPQAMQGGEGAPAPGTTFMADVETNEGPVGSGNAQTMLYIRSVVKSTHRAE
jgi:hypothetical protein